MQIRLENNTRQTLHMQGQHFASRRPGFSAVPCEDRHFATVNFDLNRALQTQRNGPDVSRPDCQYIVQGRYDAHRRTGAYLMKRDRTCCSLVLTPIGSWSTNLRACFDGMSFDDESQHAVCRWSLSSQFSFPTGRIN